MINKATREKAMAAILSTPTVKAAADAIGISERSMYDIMGRDNFREELEERRLQLVEASCSALQAKIGEASDVLSDIMNNPKMPAQARVNAAKTVISFALRSVEMLDILPRLEALEDAEARRNRR